MRIAGRVIDDKGAPIGGAVVHAKPDDDLHPAAEAESDDEGKFVLAGLDAGKHVLTATHEGRGRAVLSASAGSEDVVIKLPPGGVIAGRVVDAAGAPVAEFNVAILAKNGLRRDEVATVSVIDPEGRFEIDTLPVGDLLVMATAHGFAPSPPVPAHAAVNREEQVAVEIRLGRGGTLTGTVVDAQTHAPLEYARVSVEIVEGNGSSALPMGESTITDAQGAFQLTGLAPGRRSITTGAYGHDMAVTAGLNVVEGGVLGPMSIALEPTKPGESPKLELAGIGVQIGAGDDALVIQALIAGGGAAEAGLRPGDAILGVDGVAVVQLGFTEAIQHLRGPEGTTVLLAVRRAEQAFETLVYRRKIRA
jgi:hypothetical protein